MSLRQLGRVARHEEDYEQAQKHLQESDTIATDSGNRSQRAKTNLERARLELARGDTDAARTALREARSTFEELSFRHDCAQVHLLQGRLASDSGSPDKAREHWQAALETFESVGAPQDALQTLTLLVERCPEDDSTAKWVDRARDIFDTAPQPVQERYREWLENVEAG